MPVWRRDGSSRVFGRHLFELGIFDPVGDLLGNRMPERSARSRALRVEVRTDGVLSLKDVLPRAIGNTILDVARLATGAQTNDKTLRSVPRAPSCDFCIDGINRALRCRGGFRDDVEFSIDQCLQIRMPDSSVASATPASILRAGKPPKSLSLAP